MKQVLLNPSIMCFVCPWLAQTFRKYFSGEIACQPWIQTRCSWNKDKKNKKNKKSDMGLLALRFGPRMLNKSESFYIISMDEFLN